MGARAGSRAGERAARLTATIVGALLIATGTGVAPASADAPNVVSGHGITVSGWRWVTARTLEVDIASGAVAAVAVNGAHRVRVTLPVSYFQQETERFPVLYLLHGGAGGNSAQWTSGGGDTETITQAAQLITVMPDGGKVGWYTNWVDQSRGAQAWPTFHLTQLIAWVDANFRTVSQKSGRAIAGLSMGGFGAIRYAQDRPDLFAYAASFSGALDLNDPRIRGTIMEESGRNGFRPDGAFGNPFPPADEGFRSLDPIGRAARLDGVGVALYAGSGSNPFDQLEGTVSESTTRMHEALDDAGIPHFYWMYGRPGPSAPYGCDGGHNFGCWNFAFRDALPRIMAELDAPPPPPPPDPPPPGVEAIENGGFEAATNAPWVCSGACGVDRGIGLARSGANNGWVRSNSGSHDIHQTIGVAPDSTYLVKAWVRTSANTATRTMGLRTPGGTVVGQRTFGVLGAYTLLTARVHTGTHASLDFFARLTASGDTWIQIDDVSVVSLPPSTTSLVSSAQPSALGDPVTFTATVSPAPAAGETVTFKDGTTALGTGTTDVAGVASFTTSDLATGSHPITASYDGNDALGGSTSSVLTQVVKEPTATTLTSSGSPVMAGDPVTFTATVAPEPAAGETVTFHDGATVLGTAPTGPGGVAGFTTSDLSVGSHAITATYGGNGTLFGSTSAVLAQTVDPDTVAPGAPVFTHPAAGSLIRTADVEVGGTAEPLATVVLSGGGPLGSAVADAGGMWSRTITLAEGPHTLTAVARDAAGNESPTATRSFTVDLTTPARPVVTAPVHGSLHPGFVTITGFAEPGAVVYVIRGEGVVGSPTAGADGSWSLALTWPTGFHTFVSRAVDAAGNVSDASTPRTFEVDATPPSATIARPTVLDLLFSGPLDEVTLTGGAADNRGVVFVEVRVIDAVTGALVRNVAASCSGCPGTAPTWSTMLALPRGVYRIEVRSADQVGNASDPSTTTLLRL